jgi:hypothetical protein
MLALERNRHGDRVIRLDVSSKSRKDHSVYSADAEVYKIVMQELLFRHRTWRCSTPSTWPSACSPWAASSSYSPPSGSYRRKQLSTGQILFYFHMRCSRVARERLTASGEVATVLGSIPASSDTVGSEGRQMKQC